MAYPERIVTRLAGSRVAEGEALARATKVRELYFNRLVEKQGLRAQLRSGSLLTGERLVALDFFADAPNATVDWTVERPVFPTMPSTLPEVEARIDSILVKLDSIPYQAIGDDLKKTLESLNKLLAHADTELTPELKATLVELRAAIVRADRLMENANTNLTGPDAPTQQALRDALEEIARAARAVRDLTDYLERHPDALIRGKDEEKN